MAAVLHLGESRWTSSPRAGATAAKAYNDSLTTWRGTLGRIGAGAQQSVRLLMRPKRPSSMNTTKGARPRRARSTATSVAKFFKSRLRRRILLGVAGSGREFAPTSLGRQAIYAGEGDRVPDKPFVIPLENIGHDDAALSFGGGVPVEQGLGLVGG